MKRRRKLGFLIVVAVGIGTTCWLVLRTRDPVYQGQTLSYWFDQFNPVLIAELGSASEAPAYGRILTALREIGPSARAAVPVIIKTIKDRRGMSNDHGIDIQAVCLKALEEIDPEAAVKAGVK